MTSPRLLRPRSYSLQFRILYFFLYWRLTRLDFAATMTLPPPIFMVDWTPPPPLACSLTPIHAPTPQFADQQGVERLDQHVRQLQIGAGVCDAELPWVALPVKKRIGFLKNEWQGADKLFRDGHQTTYEKEAVYIYGLLREAWERGLEEVLLEGVVVRFRADVQTQQIEKISDITPEDCKTVDIAMTKCSKWLPGHDQAPAAKQDVPEPDELKADIDELENWVSTIRKRRT